MQEKYATRLKRSFHNNRTGWSRCGYRRRLCLTAIMSSCWQSMMTTQNFDREMRVKKPSTEFSAATRHRKNDGREAVSRAAQGTGVSEQGRLHLCHACRARKNNIYGGNVLDTMVEKLDDDAGSDCAVILAGYRQDIDQTCSTCLRITPASAVGSTSTALASSSRYSEGGSCIQRRPVGHRCCPRADRSETADAWLWKRRHRKLDD